LEEVTSSRRWGEGCGRSRRRRADEGAAEAAGAATADVTRWAPRRRAADDVRENIGRFRLRAVECEDAAIALPSTFLQAFSLLYAFADKTLLPPAISG